MHKFHLQKLEGIMRLVTNDVLEVDIVDPLKDDLEYYLDSYNDEDYVQVCTQKTSHCPWLTQLSDSH
jgi:CCR4-NOT transcriptional regulation complex NOT5 subunit